MITLRPHHILCMKFYKGKGYSEDFVDNMDKITGLLKSKPDSIINLKAGCDILCSCCPHKTNEDGCESGQKVEFLDSAVITSFNLTDGKTYKYGELKELVDKTLTPSMLENICGDCEWYKMGTCKLD